MATRQLQGFRGGEAKYYKFFTSCWTELSRLYRRRVRAKNGWYGASVRDFDEMWAGMERAVHSGANGGERGCVARGQFIVSS